MFFESAIECEVSADSAADSAADSVTTLYKKISNVKFLHIQLICIIEFQLESATESAESAESVYADSSHSSLT